jgi:hypothetical protein
MLMVCNDCLTFRSISCHQPNLDPCIHPNVSDKQNQITYSCEVWIKSYYVNHFETLQF